MAETSFYNPVWQCGGKQQYRTKRFAKRIAVQSMSAIGPDDGRINPRKAVAYRCPHCRFWHVGHKTERSPIAVDGAE